ncbi:MAG TPA: outer membrane protein transport protein [Polyangiaceae bacterium]|nr:outer membrane protein transport protein [Polyangiaceae bacterium]
MKRDLRWLGGASAALVALSSAGTASASSGIDSPENGVVQVGRGSAWLAKADEPLAAYYNPAGLVRQASGVHVGAHIMLMDRCFTRQGPGGVPVSPGASLPGPGAEGGPEAAVCKEMTPFPNPQLALSLRLAPSFALGFSFLGPHGVGKSSWPESIPYTNKFGIPTTQPAPQRYMLVTSDASILLPTISASYAVNDSLSFGAGFTWGLALVEFVNFTEGLSPAPAPGETPTDDFFAHGDVKATLSASDLFIPGFVVGGLWSPTRNFDLAGWFTWKDALRAKADLRAESNYWKQGGVKDDDPCRMTDANTANDLGAGCNVTEAKGAGDLVFRLPMEAKIGMRFHYPHPLKSGTLVRRPDWADKQGMIVRDALSEDLFDVELDFTWAHNSVLKNLELSFPKGVAIKGTPGAAPEDSDVAHEWRDVVGVRLGGDYVVAPNLLAVRAGAFYETKGQDDEYLNIDFHLGSRVGLSAGATLRVWRLDLSLAYQHTFFGTLDNGGSGSLKAISGDQSSAFRSRQGINGGKLTTSLDEIGLGATFHY